MTDETTIADPDLTGSSTDNDLTAAYSAIFAAEQSLASEAILTVDAFMVRMRGIAAQINPAAGSSQVAMYLQQVLQSNMSVSSTSRSTLMAVYNLADAMPGAPAYTPPSGSSPA